MIVFFEALCIRADNHLQIPSIVLHTFDSPKVLYLNLGYIQLLIVSQGEKGLGIIPSEISIADEANLEMIFP